MHTRVHRTSASLRLPHPFTVTAVIAVTVARFTVAARNVAVDAVVIMISVFRQCNSVCFSLHSGCNNSSGWAARSVHSRDEIDDLLQREGVHTNPGSTMGEAALLGHCCCATPPLHARLQQQPQRVCHERSNHVPADTPTGGAHPTTVWHFWANAPREFVVLQGPPPPDHTITTTTYNKWRGLTTTTVFRV